jgi:hypothetical protein
MEALWDRPKRPGMGNEIRNSSDIQAHLETRGISLLQQLPDHASIKTAESVIYLDVEPSTRSNAMSPRDRCIGPRRERYH